MHNQKKTISHNQRIWDEIADSFDKTRRKPWQQCLDFISTFQNNDVVLDLGCGNGRHLFPAIHHAKTIIGVDISSQFLHIVQKKKSTISKNSFELIHGDAQNLPFKKNLFDKVMFIASIHNIKGRKNRVKALEEVRRVLKPQGKAMISIWTRWQDTFRNQMLSRLFRNISQREFGDVEVLWRQDSLNIPRFYHLYSKKEFYTDIVSAKLHIINIQKIKMRSKLIPDNYFALVEK